MFFDLYLYDLQAGDNAGALKAYELMWNSGYQRAVTSATFNKLIQSASQTEGLESALQVDDSLRTRITKDRPELSSFFEVHQMQKSSRGHSRPG